MNARIVQTAAWTGTLDQATGAMALTAALSLQFKLSCDHVANATCGTLTGASGNLGTWAVAPKKPAELSTGHAAALAPPAAYGPDWVPPAVEDGAPLDAATGALTLVDNKLELERLDPTDCIDTTSPICNNPGLGGIVVVELNNAIGASWGGAARRELQGHRAGGDRHADGVRHGERAHQEHAVGRRLRLPAARHLERSAQRRPLVFGEADVELLSLYTAGGDDADFWVANDGCRGIVATAAACTVKVRFNPGARGNRATALYARVRDPQDVDTIRTLQIAALSGQGGQLPQGPAGPKGDGAAQAPAIAQGLASATPESPSIRRAKSRLRLSSKGTATVATIKCPAGSCRVSGRSARLKIGTKTHKVAVTGSRTIAGGKSAAVRVSVGKRVRMALRGGAQEP